MQGPDFKARALLAHWKRLTCNICRAVCISDFINQTTPIYDVGKTGAQNMTGLTDKLDEKTLFVFILCSGLDLETEPQIHELYSGTVSVVFFVVASSKKRLVKNPTEKPVTVLILSLCLTLAWKATKHISIVLYNMWIILWKYWGTSGFCNDNKTAHSMQRERHTETQRERDTL